MVVVVFFFTVLLNARTRRVKNIPRFYPLKFRVRLIYMNEQEFKVRTVGYGRLLTVQTEKYEINKMFIISFPL